MRILIINIGYAPFIGGSQTYAQEIAERLAADGHDVQVLTTTARETDDIWRPGQGAIEGSESCINGVKVRRFRVRHLPLSPYSYYALRRAAIELSRVSVIPERWLWLLARFTPRASGLDEALRGIENVDVVHGMSIPFESLMYSGFGYAHRQGLPFVATPFIHLGEKESDSVRRFYIMRHQISMLRNSEAVFALTPRERDHMVEQGVSKDKVHVVGAGVDLDRLAGGDAQRFRRNFGIERPFAFYLGAVAFEKGAVHTVEAMRRLWAQGFGADLVLAGSPFDHFVQYFNRLPDADKRRCHLLGPISDQDKRDLLACGEVMVMPSRTESFGIAYLEAWAYQKPVIGARAGAVPDVISDGVDGYLVPFGDIGAIARGVERLVRDSDEAARLGQSGRAKVANWYTWDKVYARVAEVYEEVAGGRRQ